MESYLQFIEELSIPERERRKIMWENAARLFRLSPSDSLFATPSARQFP